MTAPAQKTPTVFLDGFGYDFGGQNDSLKEDLRKIEGVPNATCLAQAHRMTPMGADADVGAGQDDPQSRDTKKQRDTICPPAPYALAFSL